jgi:large subunit ribosomal protein L30
MLKTIKKVSTAATPGKLKVTLTKSFAQRPERQRATARALGLNKISQTRLHPDNPQIRGMVNKIIHLVAVEEVAAE